MDVKLQTKDLTRTNFILGEDRPDYTSLNQTTYIPHQHCQRNEIKELSQDLRRHHFQFGNDAGDQMTSIQKQDYIIPAQIDQQKSKISNALLRQSNFSLGDKSQQMPDHYATTYSTTMLPKDNIKNDKNENVSFKSSLTIAGKDPITYQTETRSK
jgi:hypothetical protein